MYKPITVLVPFRLADGISEADLLNGSDIFQAEFVDKEPGVLRRELVAKEDGSYLDIVQFRSQEDALKVMEKERTCSICHRFFSLLEMNDSVEAESSMSFYSTLAVYE